jgi:hypothetical protein
MAVTTYLACGFEAGLKSFLLENSWFSDFGVPQNGAGVVHRTLGGAGGNWSFYCNARIRTPILSTNVRWAHAWYYDVNNNSDLCLQFSLTGARQLTLTFTASTGIVRIYNGLTVIALSGGGVWNHRVSHWISVRAVTKSVGGSCTVFIDGLQVLTYSGDTAEQATDDWNQFGVGDYYGGFPNWAGILDDLIITDDDGGTLLTPMPESYGFPIVPDGVVSGNLTGVAVVGANRFQNIDELPPLITDYNLAAASGDEDLYSLTAPASGVTIQCVSIWAEAARDGTITQAQLRTVSGASDTYGTAVVLPASPSYSVINRIHDRNPDGDVAWTNAAIAALQVGLKFT